MLCVCVCVHQVLRAPHLEGCLEWGGAASGKSLLRVDPGGGALVRGLRRESSSHGARMWRRIGAAGTT